MLDKTPLALRKRTGDQCNWIDSKNADLVLIIGVEMGCVMGGLFGRTCG